MSLVTIERSNHVAVVTMRRAEAGNALNAALLCELLTVLKELAHDDEIRAIVTAAVGKARCAGGDHAALTDGFGDKQLNDVFYGVGDSGARIRTRPQCPSKAAERLSNTIDSAEPPHPAL